jgi:hypothetical protein
MTTAFIARRYHSPVLVQRPIVRSFSLHWIDAAAEHVRAGGHAVLWRSEQRAVLVVRRPAAGDMLDLGRWAVLDLGLVRWRVPKKGPLAGLAVIGVPSDCAEIVRSWAERDSAHP